jgi:pyridoxamine 5'-phosphate oxidase family protein
VVSMERLTPRQRAYLATQRLGRLATVRADGSPQNNPVTFTVDDEGRILIGGFRMGATQKYRNVTARPQVAFVVDDLVSVEPWQVRCLEVRGTAEALPDEEPLRPGFTREQLRITPVRVLEFGLDEPAASTRA